VVEVSDIRPAVKEQVQSLGGKFIDLPNLESGEGQGGYAKEMSKEFLDAEYALFREQAKDVDIVITTALIPGRPAPRLITAADVAAMKPGSVIVDMAAAQGGNVEGTVAGEVVTTGNQVTIIGYTDLVARLPQQSSQLYGTNLVNLMKLLTPGKDGQLVLDLDDVVQRGITVVKDNAKLWPPPPVQVSAAASASAPALASPGPAPLEEKKVPVGVKTGLVPAGATLLFLLDAFAPAQIKLHLTVLTLAIVIGFYVIGKVHHALHTPLMSITNAVSGVIVVGALIQVGTGDTLIRVLAGAAILLASVNIFGGFAVTRRMLAMFSRGN
jgi:NAD(P) transhydrogenase subunit alpha